MLDKQEQTDGGEKEDPVLREELLARLAHELRNPLGTISNAIQVLRLTGEKDETWRRAIDTAEREVLHEALLVDGLLAACEMFTQAEITLLLPPEESASATRFPEGAEEHAAARKILVVEDNPDAAATMRDFLELSGHEVELATSGTDGVAAAREFHPEIVLCDLGLPGMDGYQVAKALKRDPGTASARLIAVTGYGREEDRRRSKEAGFELHLTKPVDPVKLRRLLQ